MKVKTKRYIFVIASLILLLSIGVAQAADPPAGGGSGAIFTTTPDGSIVNENVHYAGRHYVYLDGGPKQNAPSTAAGLDEGYYVFQVTDPPGKILLSRDPARCRIVHVNAAGVIDQLVPPTDAAVVGYTGATTDNWEDDGNGNHPYKEEPCHMAGPDPDSAPGTYAPTPDITGVGRHDTNPDVDHSDVGAIVVQLMPYGLTPNPGGVYKAWLTPITAYVEVKQADLNEIPIQLPKGKQKPHECFDFCAPADPGFEPSHRYTKTDNFKVTEKFPAEIKVRKFEDLNGNGVWDEGEPEIGVDICVDEFGDYADCPGGWPYDFTEPLNGGTKTDLFYTPKDHVAAFAGTYTAEEYYLTGWAQTSSRLDGVYDSPFQKSVSVDVLAVAPGETHEIVFGNFKLVDVTACKVEDADGDLATTDDQTPVNGWTVYLSIDGERQEPGQLTYDQGCYTWTGLGPGHSYDVEEDDPSPEWTPLTPFSHDFGPAVSGESYSFTFVNFKNVDVEACKYNDLTGDGLTADDEPIVGWLVTLTKNDVAVETQPTGENGCYRWTDLGPVPGGWYDVHEAQDSDWTPTSPTEYKFDPIVSGGGPYTFTFTNFKNVDVTACKLKDADGDLATTDDQTPKPGWTVYLTIDGEIEDEGVTGEDGCFTWEDLGPLAAGSYYDVEEEPVDGWIPLGGYDQDGNYFDPGNGIDFESPPQSGASYTGVFVNTPTQGCTPGFWQGGSEGGQAGGRWLWDELGAFSTEPDESDPDWVTSGGDGVNPYNHDDPFCDFFGCDGYADGEDMWYYINPDMWSVNDDFHKAARSLTAAYLNASWGMAYAYSTDELLTKWADALAAGTLLDLHMDLDDANNAMFDLDGDGVPEHNCPISASGY